MPEPVIHVHGFIEEDGNLRSVKASIIRDRTLADVATDTLSEIRRKGHKVESRSTRTLDGWLRQVDATITVKGYEDSTPQWHAFLYASEPWPETAPLSHDAGKDTNA